MITEVSCAKYHKRRTLVSTNFLPVTVTSAILMTTDMTDQADMAQEATAVDSTDDAVGKAASRLREDLPQSLLLSQLVGPAPPPGQQRAYVPSTAALRSEARELLHDRALRDIVRLRFGFPTEKYRDYKTYVNHPQRTMGVQMRGNLVAYPDIVVVQHPENNAKIVAEVETNETVREAVARSEWLPYSELAPLYLYVPVGKAEETLDLCRRLEIPVVGVRTWRYIAGYDEPEINDHA
jgi:hypothetical protein